MNKQELIKKIEALPDNIGLIRPHIDKKIVLGLIRQLDEPQKVVVPQFVADWITHSKNIGSSLFGAMSIFEKNFEIKKWMQWAENQETFALAWIFGYEVEKEKRYLVKIKCLNEEYKYLNYFKVDREWLFSQKEETKEYRTTHTRKELEEAGFGWVFSCEGIEIEEV